MLKRRGRNLIVFCCVSLASAEGLGDQTDARTTADQLFQEGRALLDAERTSEACAKFVASYAIDPALGTLLNLALCHELEGKTASAWREFVKAAELAEQRGEHKRRAFAAGKIEALEPGLSRVIIRAKSREHELTVFLDGRELPPAELGTPLPVDPGEHTLRATSPRAPEWTARISVPRGPSQSVIEIPEFEQARASNAAPASSVGSRAYAVTPRDSAERHSGSKTWALASGGVGLVGLGVGTYFGLRAVSAQQTVNAECAGRYCNEKGLKADGVVQDSVWPANIGIGVGVAGLGLATYLWLSGRASSGQNSAVTVSAARAGLGIEAGARF